MGFMTAVPLLVGVLPPEYATGATGTVLALPPSMRRSSWTFRVDGCRCGVDAHRTLSEAERCSAAVVQGANPTKSLPS